MTTTTFSERTNINALSQDEHALHARKTYAVKSYFQHLFNKDKVDFLCLESSVDFHYEILRTLIIKGVIDKPVPLEEIHQHIPVELTDYNFDDGVNKLSTYLYETDEAFQKVYFDFIRVIRHHIVKEPFWFQATPTIRLHCPNAKNNNHYPRYHTDIAYGHPPDEINFWLPITKTLSGHGFRMMSFEQSKAILERFNYDYKEFIHQAINNHEFSAECDRISQPVNTPFGFVCAFDSRCIHSGMPLKEHTRVSMDIRILPLSQYEKMPYCYQGSGRRKIIFAPGNCYYNLSSDQI